MSKVYILLKDTPFNKAGTEFSVPVGFINFFPKGNIDSFGVFFTEEQIIDLPDWFKLKETPKRGRPKKSYTPKVGETVRVVECVSGNKNHVELIGEVVQITANGIGVSNKTPFRYCDASKVEPVEKKQLRSELDEYISLYVEAWYNRTMSYVDMDHGDKWYPRCSREEWIESVKEDVIKLFFKRDTLDEQHIAGREK